ncbi:antibiotic biosynthesis monooxygenase [Vallicoccus soli]|uniref:Antibiotic biosynthesis monooxygenase n=1 Tax=Vallicoccus soli TaxID=2339232 RepID=A0A3A3ZG48_9ACTN|nr:antibiotic biosynthesis monooxygenase [Vallicoccus soli]RJK94166.1 antibiotic biosynthesis monooxygenase [Vallicoccus soli]
MSGADAPTVTTAVTRRSPPDRAPEMSAWVRAGAALAEGFPGFLGFGWVRAGEGSDEWHMLYRFARADQLAAWERSAQRRWWLASAQGIVEETRTERRTGVEGWFDAAPAAGAPAPATTGPPRWKQATVIWCGFFPVSLAANATVGGATAAWPVLWRTLLLTLLLTPVMTYLVLPAVTRALQPWLRR